MKLTIVLSIFLISFIGFAQDRKPYKVGEEINRTIESPHPYMGNSSQNYELVWKQTISENNASYIAVHFQKFELAFGDYLIIRNPENTRFWKYSLGTESRQQFWSIHIYGDTAIIEIFSKNDTGGFGYKIDKIAKGFENIEMRSPTALCGMDDTKEAVCYKNSEPFVYEKSRAIARLLINGTSACTGWLIGDDGHLMTNEHCIGNAIDANNVTVEFMAEGANCMTDCTTWFGCGGTIVATSTTLVKANANLDYALLKLPTNVSSTYGFLQLRETGAVLNERIYIPQHPQAWGKRIALESTDSHDTGGKARVYSLNEPRCGGTGNDIGYYADTQGGSSGSPVIGYSDHLVIALHHCADCPNRGVPIEEIINDLGNDIPNNAISSLDIIGSSFICGTETYTLVDAPPNSVVNWTVSSTLNKIFELDNSVTVEPMNSYTSGGATITASVNGYEVHKDVWVGAPQVVNPRITSHNGNNVDKDVYINSHDVIFGSELSSGAQYEWEIAYNGNSCSNATLPYFVGYGSNHIINSTGQVNIDWGNCPGTYTVLCYAVNDCGTTYAGSEMVEVHGYNSSDPCDENISLNVFPNPSDEVFRASIAAPPPCPPIETYPPNPNYLLANDGTGSNTIRAKIFDIRGHLRFSESYNTANFTLEHLNLEVGQYILIVTTSNGKSAQEIIIVE